MVNTYDIETATGTIRMPKTVLREPISGARLRRVRRELGMSQVALAKLVGLTPKHWSRLECGYLRASGPLVRALEFLVDALERRPSEN